MKKTITSRAVFFMAVLAFLSCYSIPQLHADVIDPNGGKKNFHYGPNGPVLNGQDDNVSMNPSVEPITVAPKATPAAVVSAHKKKAKKSHSASKKAVPPVSQATPSK